jgi:NAD(P)H-dependent flavin oxidoreductase YrpB (nitropropane dioxygenase family)
MSTSHPLVAGALRRQSGTCTRPVVIQGGMGIGVSSWRVARAVALRGQLGVVSGTGIDSVLVRRLQDGDPGGDLRRAMERFPIPRVAAAVLRAYLRREGRPPGAPYKALPIYQQVVSEARQELTMLAAFVEVHLAKEGHGGPVGMNLLTKIQLPNLTALYGAMLAGVDFVLMGAGIPRDVPAALDALAEHRPASLRLDVEGLPPGVVERVTLDPREHWDGPPPDVRRPQFLAIVASDSLATVLARKSSGRVDGFVVEGPTAGGHNAPPRGAASFNGRGEPVYGTRDEVDLSKMRALGLPFWLAGGAGRPDGVLDARRSGAAGVQVGTLFAFCDESGLAEDLKRSVLEHAARGEVDVVTDPRASPTGYPFKVVKWSAGPDAAARERVCDLGYLRVAYRTAEGALGYRCPGEPVEAYVAKGGLREDTVGRVCLCNGLLATIGQGQVRAGGAVEPPIITGGDDLVTITTFLAGRTRYSAADVLDYLLPPGPHPALPAVSTA